MTLAQHSGENLVSILLCSTSTFDTEICPFPGYHCLHLVILTMPSSGVRAALSHLIFLLSFSSTMSEFIFILLSFSIMSWNSQNAIFKPESCLCPEKSHSLALNRYFLYPKVPELSLALTAFLNTSLSCHICLASLLKDHGELGKSFPIWSFPHSFHSWFLVIAGKSYVPSSL